MPSIPVFYLSSIMCIRIQSDIKVTNMEDRHWRNAVSKPGGALGYWRPGSVGDLGGGSEEWNVSTNLEF